MSDRVVTALREYSQSVDESQTPIGIDEILERADVVDMVPVDRDVRWSGTRSGVRVVMAAAVVAVVVGTAFMLGNLSSPPQLSPAALDPPSTLQGPNPALIRPIGDLVAGRTYELAANGAFGYNREAGVTVTAPAGWEGDRWMVGRRRGDQEAVSIAVWEVGEVFAHPCEWNGTLFDPGPSIDDLADAFAGIPLRNASPPVALTFSGHDARFIEWSVPDDIDFSSCDGDVGRYPYVDGRAGDHTYFESWVSATGGHRSQQVPGQINRLWIVDAEGTRLVIDAGFTPLATTEDLAALERAIESLEIVVRVEG